LGSELKKYREIARRHTEHGEKGGFITAFLNAFLKADDVNAGLMLPLLKHFCERFNLS